MIINGLFLYSVGMERFRKRNGSLLQGTYYHEMPLLNKVRIYNSD